MSAARRISGGYMRVLDWQNLAAVPADLVALLGTFSLSSGLRAATLAADGHELVANGNMETGDPPTGWTLQYNAVLSAALDERTGGVGTKSLAIVNGVNATSGRAYQSLNNLSDTWALVSAWGKKVTNCQAWLYLTTSGGVQIQTIIPLSVGAWASGSFTAKFSGVLCRIVCVNSTATQSDEARYDDITIQATIAQLLLPVPLLHASYVCAVAWPAAPDVTPFALYLRGSDALNYFEVRLTPNTAGTDTQVIEHVAGVQTVRASADVDWTPSATDMVMVRALGSTIAVYHQKSGASGWTLACSYTSATPAAGANKWGLQIYKAAQTYALRSIVEALE